MLHVVAMLAFKAGILVGFDPSLTILSVMISAVLCGIGFAWAERPKGALIGGAFTGAAISAMHYVGMAAVRAPADAVWSMNYVVA
jgi:NO-binding membrane sensor protein with MHYT domain